MSNKRFQMRGKEIIHHLPSHICFMLSSEDFTSSPKKICDIVQWAIDFSTELIVQDPASIRGIVFHLHSVLTSASEVMTVLSDVAELAPCAWYTAEECILPNQMGIKTDSRSYSPYAPEVLIVAGVSGRQEIAETLTNLARQEIQPAEVTEKMITENLRFPDSPDLVIKTRERHLVDFMIWQTAYSELYFTQAPLSAFTQRDFKKALLDYQSRIRKFGR